MSRAEVSTHSSVGCGDLTSLVVVYKEPVPLPKLDLFVFTTDDLALYGDIPDIEMNTASSFGHSRENLFSLTIVSVGEQMRNILRSHNLIVSNNYNNFGSF